MPRALPPATLSGYHCTCDCKDVPSVCGLPLLPIGHDNDFIDEAILFLRANLLFQNFQVASDADKLLIYITLYLSSCLRRLAQVRPDRAAADKMLFALAHDPFLVPGDIGFVLGGLVTAPADKEEADRVRVYLRQCRERAGERLLQKCYLADDSLSKWWAAFANRRFLNKTL